MTDERRCATCRWWGDAVDHHRRRCDRIKHEGNDDEHPEEPATAADWEGYKAWLHTRADFGCVLWESK